MARWLYSSIESALEGSTHGIERPPEAFLSYTRFDDENDGGAISEFRRRLASAVRAVTGEPFEIFQDVDGIGLGQRWSGKLDEMLEEARFFIPIVTPSYFRSKACREELEKFLRAEAELGRDDLILPIYYIESYVLEEEELRATDPLARIIHERQQQDWRDLRFEPFDAKEVRRALERLARGIARSRSRPVPSASAVRAEQNSIGTTEPSPSASAPPPPAEPGDLAKIRDRDFAPEPVVLPRGEFMMGSTQVERQWGIEQGAKRDALLDELRALAQSWPEDAAVGKQLAMGLYNALNDAKEEQDLARRDTLLDELRAVAKAWPQDAAVRVRLATGLLDTLRDATKEQDLARRDALLDELRALAKAWSEDVAVREWLAMGLYNTHYYAREEQDLARRDALLEELRALAKAWPEDAAVRGWLAKGLYYTHYDAKKEQDLVRRDALLDELRALAKAWPEDAAVRGWLAMTLQSDGG